MSWQDLDQIELDLTHALTSFNWSVAEEICRRLIIKIYSEPDELPAANSKRILSKLRRKRLFNLMAMLAEAILRSGQVHSQVRRQYAQSLIDQEILGAGEMVLNTMLQDPDTSSSEKIEARGLLGRIYKQLYVNIGGIHNPKKQVFLERALNEYLESYKIDRVRNYWHGINVLALLMRGQADGISLQGMPQAKLLAEEILSILKAKEDESAQPTPAFEVATTLEALIALNRYDEAIRKAVDYIQCDDADVFEINSTLRQLTEVWQLNDEVLPGSAILPILHAALLRRKGGELTFNPQESKLEIKNISGLEKVFGIDRTQTLKWYKTGWDRAWSVARLETLGGRGIGTGWLVEGEDFFPNYSGLLLITNAHVVSLHTPDSGLPPYQVRANFQELKMIYELGEIIWSSPQINLDTTFVTIKGNPPLEPLPIDLNPIQMSSPPPRIYIIGHPGGRDCEVSLHDNHLIARNDTFLHYRTPTEVGSSGSPVFDQDGWRVVALHHCGKIDMPRIDGQKGTYEANEGISLLAIKRAIQNGFQPSLKNACA